MQIEKAEAAIRVKRDEVRSPGVGRFIEEVSHISTILSNRIILSYSAWW
jgi:hypothetical protein